MEVGCMFRIPSDQITEGMVLARNITDSSGRVLLTAGQVFSKRYALRIQELQIPYVYIDEQLGIEVPEPPVSPATVSAATASLKKCYEQYAKTGQTDLGSIQCQIDNIINDLANNSHIKIGMSELKSYDDYTYQHSVNVCVLSLIIGMSQGYSHLQLKNLGIGAILHDIGKIKIPLEIVNKPSSLTYKEYIEVKKHPWEGFTIINALHDFPQSSTQAILQHHERIDRRGYPRGLKGIDIHEFGLIVAVADVFDALVSDRPYRAAFCNREAMEIMEQEKGTKLSESYIDALFSHINMYAPGTVVCLSNGDLAVVTKENPKASRHPHLKLLFDPDMQAYQLDTSLDLNVRRDISVKRVLNYQEAEECILKFLTLHKIK